MAVIFFVIQMDPYRGYVDISAEIEQMLRYLPLENIHLRFDIDYTLHILLELYSDNCKREVLECLSDAIDRLESKRYCGRLYYRFAKKDTPFVFYLDRPVNDCTCIVCESPDGYSIEENLNEDSLDYLNEDEDMACFIDNDDDINMDENIYRFIQSWGIYERNLISEAEFESKRSLAIVSKTY